MIEIATPLLTVKELAQRLRVSEATAYILVKQGKIASYRIGGNRGAIRIRPEDVVAYLASAMQPASNAMPLTKPVRIQLKHMKLK